MWRLTEDDTFQLIDSAVVGVAAGSSFVPVSGELINGALLEFSEGDFLGFSVNSFSPLVYSELADEASEHLLFSHLELLNYPGLEIGETLEVLNTSYALLSTRAYSLEISIEGEIY